MMMKYRSKSKLVPIIILLAITAIVFFNRSQILKLTSPLSESVTYTINRLVKVKTEIISENQQLNQMLAMSLSENQQLKKQLRQTGSDHNLVFGNDSVITTASISSIPLVQSGLDDLEYGISFTDSKPESTRSFVVSDSFLYGLTKASGDNFRTFKLTDNLQAVLSDGSTILISKIPKPFIYQIELEKATNAPDGLIESRSGKVLGFKIDRTELNATTDLITYRLPILPRLYQKIELIRP